MVMGAGKKGGGGEQKYVQSAITYICCAVNFIYQRSFERHTIDSTCE